MEARDFMKFLIRYSKLKNNMFADKITWQQKMLFFIQFEYFKTSKNKENSFFNDEFIAWQYGPVILDVYKKQRLLYDWFDEDKEFKLLNEEGLKSRFNNDEKWNSFIQTYNKYAHLNSLILSYESHKLNCWKNAFSNGLNSPVTNEQIFLDAVEELKENE